MKAFILWLLTPVQKFLQRSGRQESKVTKTQVDSMMSKAEPGDIFLSFEYGRPTSFLIKGFWDHATILSSKMTIVEAVGDKFENGINVGGVREVDLEEWLYKKDFVSIIRPVYNDDDSFQQSYKIINKQAAANSLYYKGKPYDYSFKIDDERIYCSELVYLCYIPLDPDFMGHIDGEILPQHYYDMTKDMPSKLMYFELVYDSREHDV